MLFLLQIVTNGKKYHQLKEMMVMCNIKSFRDGTGEVKELGQDVPKPKTTEELRKLAIAKGLIKDLKELVDNDTSL